MKTLSDMEDELFNAKWMVRHYKRRQMFEEAEPWEREVERLEKLTEADEVLTEEKSKTPINTDFLTELTK